MPVVYIAATFFHLGPLSPTQAKNVGRPWAPPKNCSTKGEVLISNTLVERLYKIKKCYYKPLFEVLMVG